MSPALPRTAPLHALMQCRRSILVVSFLCLASCTLSSPAKSAEPESPAVKLAATSALRAAAVSGTAPTLVPPSAMRVNPGETADQALHATDPDGDPLTFSKVLGPSYMTVTTTDPGSGSATGGIHLAPPIPTDIGPTSGTVAVSDGFFSDQRSFRIVISTTPPVLAQPDDMTVTEGGSADQTLSATDEDGDPVTFRLVSGPVYATVTTVEPGAGLAFGSVHLAPVEGDAGTSTADVGASDGIVEDVKRFQITVERLNHQPVLDPILPMVVTAQTESFQTIHASDPDLDPLTFFIAGGPSYVTVSTTSSSGGSATGTIRVAPTFNDRGSAAAGIGVTDGALSDTKLLSISVVLSFSNVTCAPTGIVQEPPLRRVPEPRFASGFRAFDASHAPQSFVLDDIDGDGVEDVVSASDDCGIVILFGSRGGTFSRSVRYDTGGTGARAVAVADFDGDGIKDLAAPNQFLDTFAVLFGVGGGAFRSPVLYHTAARPVHIAAGDLNRDGRPDLVTTDEVGNVVSIFLNDGSGGFASSQRELVGVRPCSTTIVDLNRDGALDLVTVNETSNSVSVLLGHGDGTFSTQVQYATGGDPRSVEAGDLNNDGVLDLVVANFQGSVSTLLGNGDGTFAPRQDTQAGISPWSVALGDVNSDGILDCVTANVGASNCTVLLGRGDGTFTFHTQFPGGFLARYADLEDVNGDGKLDVLLVSEGGNTLTVHPGNGDGTFGNHRAAAVGSSPGSVVLGDWNRDGRLDLVTTSTDTPLLTVRMGRADGGFDPATSVGVGGPTMLIRTADFNGDGISDLAALLVDGTGIVTLRGNGDGSFGPATILPVEGQPLDFSIGDVTGDHVLDLVVPDRTGGALAILAGRGDGSFAPPSMIGAGAHPATVALGDFDGDGFLDAVTGNGLEGSVSILRGTRGSLELVAVLPTGGSVGDVALADLDRDGRVDLVALGEDALLSFRGRGDGTFEAARVAPALGRGHGIAIGDLNGDSIPDVVTAGFNFVSVLPGVGDGTLDPYIAFGTGFGPGLPVIGDMNADGLPDLITVDHLDNTVDLLLNEGAKARNRAPVADPGGPYAGIARIPLEFDGSRSADPDGDALTFAWTFDDGGTGTGMTPSHAYVAGGTYNVCLTVTDTGTPSLSDTKCTTAAINDAFAARVFRRKTNKIQLYTEAQHQCFQIEPIGRNFMLTDVNPSTVVMKYGGIQVSGETPKTSIKADTDHNGIAEIQTCFSTSALRTLFVALPSGVSTVTVSIEGDLTTGGRFHGDVTFKIQKDDDTQHVSVSPNPLNPTSTLTLFMPRPGFVRVKMYDLNGRMVRTLMEEGNAAAGYHDVTIDGRGATGERLASGVYFYQVETVAGRTTGRFMILK